MKAVLTVILLSIAAITIILHLYQSKKENNNVKQSEEGSHNTQTDILEVNEIPNKEINKKQMLDEMLQEFIVKKPQLINAVERGIRESNSLKDEIYKFLSSKAYTLNEEETNDIINEFETYIWGYGPLQELIDNPNISDIKIIDENNIRVKELGKRKNSNVKFGSKEKLREYINFIAVKNGITLSEINAIQRITDKNCNGFLLRMDISSEYVNSVDNPYLHIRKISKSKDDLEQLESKKMFNDEIRKYLVKAMKSSLGILVCGKGGSGKTTLMNALIEEIPYDKSGLVLQEAEEIYSNNHPDLMFQKIIPNKVESNIEYTLADLIRNGLVADVDYMVIGEIKSAEAWDFINAAYTGHVPIASLHTINAEEAPNKLVHYMKYSSSSKDMTEGELLETLMGVDVIIFMKDFKVNEITEISGFDRDKERLLLNPVFKYVLKSNTDEFIKLNDSCSKVKEKLFYSKAQKYNNNEKELKVVNK